MDARLQELKKRYEEIESELSKPETVSDQKMFRDLNREHSQLSPVITRFNDYLKMKKDLADSKELIETEKDPEMRQMLQSEIEELEQKIDEMKEKLLVMLLPKDPDSGKDILIEIRAGTGGDEAALFSADLFRMYTRYAEVRGWKVELIDASTNELGGYKEVIFSLRNPEAYDTMKYESGVHRVQRVPATESQGRIHTSAVTVAVMPEAEEDEMEIDPNDIRTDVYRSSGHGGQSVNTTDSAVRITHIPTGMVVTCQDEKSQIKNKAKALRVLKARLLEKTNSERMAKESELRKSQVGSGDRSERIRTYNFPQNRVTDHRIGLTLYSLEKVLEGEMEDLVDALKKAEIESLLKTVK
ncbi:MAG TPA: peptide chain release factor 1 [Spirochaetota bacterium]|nr:peptide chain release factor 1 [Spirochaetota bacterium]HQO39606.1 peptide chain release factor 1 [Spirochaetota bacterium]